MKRRHQPHNITKQFSTFSTLIWFPSNVPKMYMNHLRQRCLSLFSILFPSNTPSFFLYPVYITLFLRKHFNSKPFSYRSDFYLTAISLAKAFFFWQSTHKLKPYHGKLMKNEMDPRKSVLFNSASQTIPQSHLHQTVSVYPVCVTVCTSFKCLYFKVKPIYILIG